MAAADDRTDSDGATGRLKELLGGRTGDAGSEHEGRSDQGTGPVKHNIDRVADKVKGLLRSDR
jgi:uncharacterized protein YjbJ (UPF0337 family)